MYGAPRGKHCIIIVRTTPGMHLKALSLQVYNSSTSSPKNTILTLLINIYLASYTVLLCSFVECIYIFGHHSGSLDHSLFSGRDVDIRLDMCVKNASTNETKIKGSLARGHANSDKTLQRVVFRDCYASSAPFLYGQGDCSRLRDQLFLKVRWKVLKRKQVSSQRADETWSTKYNH